MNDIRRPVAGLSLLLAFASALPAQVASTAATTTTTTTTTAASAPAKSDVLTLDDFVVSSTAATGYRATNSITASGIGTPIGQTPSTIDVVTKDFISDLRLDLINDALRYVPGVVTGPNNESQPFVRGFQGTYTLRNGVFRRQNLLSWNVDSVEVIQGPSSIFYSNIRPGGVINYNTTKPVFGQNFLDLDVSGGTYDYRRAETAANAGNDQFAVRVDAGTLSMNSFRLNNNETQHFLSFAVSWKPTANQILTLEADTESVDRVNGWSAYAVPLTNSAYWLNPAAIASGQTVSAWMAANRPGQPVYNEFAPFLPSAKDPYGRVTPIMNNYQSGQDKPVDLSYTNKLTDSLAFSTILNYAYENNEGTNPSIPDPLANDTFPGSRVERFINVRDSYNADVRLTYRFDVGSVENTLMGGDDNQWVTKRVPQNAVLNVSTTPGIANSVGGNNLGSATFTYDPTHTGMIQTQALLDSPARPFNAIQDTLQEFGGLYLVDQAVLLDKSLFLVAGERFATFKQHVSYPYRPDLAAAPIPDAVVDQSRLLGLKGKFTPQFGALYKIPSTGVSLYADYSTAIQPQTQVDASGKAVQPQASKGWDVGAKSEFLDGALTGTIDYYYTLQTNTAISDSATNIAHGLPSNATFGFYFYGNAQEVRGLQGTLNYNLTKDDQLVFGINEFYEASFVSPQSNLANLGAPIVYQPATMYNIWDRYQFSSGPLKGLILGGGFHHNSEAAYGGDFNHSTINIPGFTVFDAMIGYEFKAFGHRAKVQALGKNITNKIYRDQNGYYNNPGSFEVSLSTRF